MDRPSSSSGPSSSSAVHGSRISNFSRLAVNDNLMSGGGGGDMKRGAGGVSAPLSLPPHAHYSSTGMRARAGGGPGGWGSGAGQTSATHSQMVGLQGMGMHRQNRGGQGTQASNPNAESWAGQGSPAAPPASLSGRPASPATASAAANYFSSSHRTSGSGSLSSFAPSFSASSIGSTMPLPPPVPPSPSPSSATSSPTFTTSFSVAAARAAAQHSPSNSLSFPGGVRAPSPTGILSGSRTTLGGAAAAHSRGHSRTDSSITITSALAAASRSASPDCYMPFGTGAGGSGGVDQSVTASHALSPGASLPQQIEAQWGEYMRAVEMEKQKGSSATAHSANNHTAASSSSLSTLLSRLHSNALYNFFEFSSGRTVLNIQGPSFDCLYYLAPPSVPVAAGSLSSPPGIYRDRGDYLSTLSSITHLEFRYVDFQLVTLHLPLVRQRMPQLKSLKLIHNNIHALHQLDALGVLAPSAGRTAGPSSQAAAAPGGPQLESISITHNAVTTSQLYRPYMLSLLTQNVVQPPNTETPSPNTSVTSSSSSSSVTYLGCSLQELDGQPLTEQEVLAAWHAFGAIHRCRYMLSPSASPTTPSLHAPISTPLSFSAAPLTRAEWIRILYECSVHMQGGAAALGTAANPIQMFPPPASGSYPPSALPLPLRPLTAPPSSRKWAKRATEDVLKGAMAAAEQQRSFDELWEETLFAPGGLVEGWLDEVDRRAEGGGAGAAVAAKTHTASAPRVASARAHRRAASTSSTHNNSSHNSSSLSALSRRVSVPLVGAGSHASSSSSAAALGLAQRATLDKMRATKPANHTNHQSAVDGWQGAAHTGNFTPAQGAASQALRRNMKAVG